MPPVCSFEITSRQPDGTTVGKTQACSVIAVVKSSEAASATVTQLLVPLNTSAFPKRPAVVQVADVTTPPLPLPEASAAAVPVPSSKP